MTVQPLLFTVEAMNISSLISLSLSDLIQKLPYIL